MIYATHRIKALDVVDLYNKYRDWINTINQRKGFKTTIVSTNLVQNESWYYMIITYSYE